MNKTRIYGISVGINQYTGMRPLKSSTVDALDIAGVLRMGRCPAQVKVLVDHSATKDGILRELNWLAQTANRADTAIVFFSGHGGRRTAASVDQGYFCPVDASEADVQRTCIASEEFTIALRAIESERLVVLLDTCYSGAIGDARRAGSGLDAGLSAGNVSRLIEGSGRFVMAASRPDEVAWELHGMRNGLFTSYLLSALRGAAARANGAIWVSDLFSHVSRGVRQHGLQHPFQKAIGEDFVVLVQRRDIHFAGDVSLTPQRGNPRSLRRAMHGLYNRAELSLLCRDLGLSLEDLPGATLETQLMDLIDHCQRHGTFEQLLERVQSDRPTTLSLSR